jgi:hypothetical protein
MSKTIHHERLALLETIATEVLGIDTLEQTGKLTKDLHVIHIEDLAHVLGHRVARGGDTDPQTSQEVFFP